MSTFKIKKSEYTVTPSQEGSVPIEVTGSTTANFEQDISGLPVLEHASDNFVNWRVIVASALKNSVGLSIPQGWIHILGQKYRGYPWLDWSENGRVSAADALAFLHLEQGTDGIDVEKKNAFINYLAENYEEYKDVGFSFGSNTQSLYLAKPNQYSDFNLDKHYIVFDSGEPSHRLKLIKYTKGSTFQDGYWFDAGNGSDTTGLTTVDIGKLSKQANSSELLGKYFSFHPADDVDAGTDKITLNSHGLKTNDPIWYKPGKLHTFNAETAVNTSTDKINIPSHGYSNNDIVFYTFRGDLDHVAPTGLENNTHYKVSVSDNDNIKLKDNDDNVIDITGLGLGSSHSLSAPVLPGLTASYTYFDVPLEEYYVKQSDTNNIQLAESVGGSAIDITATGLGTSHELRAANCTHLINLGDKVLVDEEASITTASGINTTTNEITTTSSHGYSTGDTTEYSAEGGTVPAGVEEGKLYYVIRVSDTKLKLAETSEDATAGTAVDITSTGSGITHKLLLKFGTTITRIENDISIFCNSANRVVFTNRNIKKPNFTIDQKRDVLLARVYRKQSIVVPLTAMPFHGSSNVDAANNKITFPTNRPDHAFSNGDLVEYNIGSGSSAVGGLTSGNNYYVINSNTSIAPFSIQLSETEGGSVISLTDGAGDGHEIKLIGTTHRTVAISGGDVIKTQDTISSASLAANTTVTSFTQELSSDELVLSQSNKFEVDEEISLEGYVLEPLVALDEAHLEDDNAPILKADLDVNDKSLKSDSINLKTRGGTKIIETTATEAKLYHNGTEHFKTISGGVQYTGNLSDGTTSIANFVTATDTIAGNNNDTTIPTSAAVKAYADSVGGGGSGTVDTSGTPTANQYARFTDADTIEGRSTSEVLSDIGAQASLTFGIADDNAVEIDDTDAASGDYAKFTANGLEGRNASEVKTDLSLNNVENTAISTFAGSANITTVGTVSTGTWQGTAIADAYISSASTWNAKQDPLTFGIANTNAVKIDSADVADDEYARFTANGLESRSTVEVASDISAVVTNADNIMATNKKIQFRDTNSFINSPGAGQLTIKTGGLVAETPTFTVKADQDSSQSSPLLALNKNDASPAANNPLGRFQWSTDNSNDTLVDFAYIEGMSDVVTNGSEEGSVSFNVRNGAGAISEIHKTDKTGIVIDTDKKIQFRQSDVFIRSNSANNIDISCPSTLSLGAGRVDIVSSEEGVVTSPILTLNKVDTTPTDGAAIGSIEFSSNDSDSSNAQYVQLSTLSDVVTEGSQEASFLVRLADGSGSVNTITTTSKDGILLNTDKAVEFRSDAQYIKSDVVGSLQIGGASTTIKADTLTVESTQSGASSGATLILENDHDAIPGDNDLIGEIIFKGMDSSPNVQEFARIEADSVDVSNTNRDGAIKFFAHVNGTNTEHMKITGNEVDITDSRLKFTDTAAIAARGSNAGGGNKIAFECMPATGVTSHTAETSVMALDDRTWMNAYGFMLSDNQGNGTFSVGTSNVVLERNVGNHKLYTNYIQARSSSTYFINLFTTGMSIQTAGDMRVRDNQYMGFGTSDDVKIFYDNDAISATIGELEIEMESTCQQIRMTDNGTTRFTFLKTSGDFTATGNVTAYSDERLKSDIETLDPKKTLQMRGVEFTKDGKKGSGVIAQELEKIAPELVLNEGEYKSVAYGNLSGYLIETIKDQQKQIDELKTLVEKLMEKV